MADDVSAESPTRADSLREYGRGLAGGLLFSLPLLYTMEVWWAGFIAGPERLLGYFAAIFVLLLGYNRYAGLRSDASWVEVAIDSVEEMGLGILTSAGMLFLIGRIDSGQSVDEIVGKIIVEAGMVAIGFSVGTAQLGQADDRDSGIAGSDDKKHSFSSDLMISICGAVLFAANVAPTEEVQVIAVETSAVRLLGLVAVSIGIAMLVLYYSDFVQSKSIAPVRSKLDVVLGTALTYAIALAVSGAMLWFFGRLDGAGVEIAVSQAVVLGCPAVLGASAGRLLLNT